MTVTINVNTLNELRFRKGWSVRSLAKAAGIGEVTAQQICNGQRQPSAPTAKKLVDALQVEFDDLFTIEQAADLVASK